jgi:hypothetical protein
MEGLFNASSHLDREFDDIADTDIPIFIVHSGLDVIENII